MTSGAPDSSENRRYYRNWTSFVGLLLMGSSFLFGLVVFIMEIVSGHGTPYTGMFFIACSFALVVGFIMIPVDCHHDLPRDEGALVRVSRQHQPPTV